MTEMGDPPMYEQPGGFFGAGGAYGYPNMGSGSDGSKWMYGLSSTGSSPIIDHYLTQQNARSAYHDSIPAHSIVNRYADTTIGKGLRLEATPDADALGRTPEELEKWSRDVEAKFHSWAKSKKSSRDECENFYQLQRASCVFYKRDGESFARFYRSRRRDLLNPLQLQFVDPSQVRGASFTSTYGFNDNENDGIIRDKAGRETGYMIYSYDKKTKTYRPTEVPARGAKSKALQMVHIFRRDYAGQGRGYSPLQHAIQEFENHTDFTAAHIKQAINQSSIAMYVKPSKDEASSNPFDQITHNIAGPLDASLAPIPGVPDDEQIDFVNYHPVPEAILDKPGSNVIVGLNSGEDMGTINMTSPMDTYKDFVETFVSHLGASVGMPGEVLLMKFGNSYSASRALLVMFWRIVEMVRDELATDFFNPVYECWLEGEIAAGRIQAPGWSDPRLRQAWVNNQWIGDPMPNIDPMRTASADKLYAEIGATTIGRISRNLNGSTAKTNKATLKREYENFPIAPWNEKPEPVAPSGGQKNPDDDDDDDNKDDN
jgi:lambda family phage portal protein